MKQFLDIELRVIVRYLRKSKGMLGVKESEKKDTKIAGIAAFLGLPVEQLNKSQQAKNVKVVTLRELAAKTISKYTKEELHVLFAEYKWPCEYNVWKEELDNITVNGSKIDWFYKPEHSLVRNQHEVKCIDSTHLLTRMRRKSCKGGLDMLTNESWLKVAKQKKTNLSQIMVEEITDPMSAAMATSHFCEDVEVQMIRNGVLLAAALCRDVRNWWKSEDQGGISAVNRIKMREPLRERLLSHINLNR
ncbi:hypothetical protein DPMN_039178 [Dreissena polymorpha]|uniref:Uncharacterized protein n=1 Tax=Dreissena polymorpha TaxID=45954 RepID=A0A9D4RNX5_DREPO|nr:hypothetical protein DPMN_039178 [Dreissena polymorpha]